MPRRGFLLAGVLLAAGFGSAQSIPTRGPKLASFLPRGYKLLGSDIATGDLNGGGRPNVVLPLAPGAGVSRVSFATSKEAST